MTNTTNDNNDQVSLTTVLEILAQYAQGVRNNADCAGSLTDANFYRELASVVDAAAAHLKRELTERNRPLSAVKSEQARSTLKMALSFETTKAYGDNRDQAYAAAASEVDSMSDRDVFTKLESRGFRFDDNYRIWYKLP